MPGRKKRNSEKSWLAILREIKKEKGEAAAWLYATALRGPDGYGIPWCVKAIFTGPLRGYKGFILAVADTSAYHWCIKCPDSVLKAFRFLMQRRDEHYLRHLISVWHVLEPGVARVLMQVLEAKRCGKTLGLSDLSTEYTRAVAKWLGRTNALPEENKDE
ncbi:MAG: hypothetical protein DRI40_07660 [Chloroflexi bacterium]|nr:MAG: hypothetical protein DRI40_07660 [Chloroflexota bacterium]